MAQHDDSENKIIPGVKLGQKIKKLRELKNLTQAHMAHEIGVSQSAYSKMELGETEITYSKLEKVASVLGMRPEEVITFHESMVFKVINNPQSNPGFIAPQQSLSALEKKLYINKIKTLKAEVEYLKRMLEKTLS